MRSGFNIMWPLTVHQSACVLCNVGTCLSLKHSCLLYVWFRTVITVLFVGASWLDRLCTSAATVTGQDVTFLARYSSRPCMHLFVLIKKQHSQNGSPTAQYDIPTAYVFRIAWNLYRPWVCQSGVCQHAMDLHWLWTPIVHDGTRSPYSYWWQEC